MTKSRHILRPRINWTPEQLEAIRTRYPHERTDVIARDLGVSVDNIYQRATALGITKSPEYLASPDAYRLRRGNNIGIEHRFKKGLVPFNKGKKGISYPGSVPAQFQKGHTNNTELPIDSLRICADGYLERKVMMRHATPARRWIAEHVLVWMAANGAVPKGHIIVFKRGMKTLDPAEITPDKLDCITRQENMKRNSYHNNYPKEVALLIQLRGAVNRKINRRLKDERATESAE